VGQICSLVLSPLGHSDKVVWQGTKHGFFSVKSAYHLEMQHRNQTRGESYTTGQAGEIWKAVWNLQAPLVLKHFFWKVCNNILPTKVLLSSKKIVQNLLCPCYLREEENIYHILWSCPSSTAVWQECPRRVLKMALEPTDGLGLIEGWLKKLTGVEFIFALAVARQIWLRRNAYVFEDFFMPSMQVLQVAKSSLEAFEEAPTTTVVERSLPGNIRVKWKKPHMGVMKINWDAALNKAMKNMGAGVVIQDDSGSFVAAISKIVPYIVDPLIAEAVAIWYAAQLACDLGLQNVLLEDDSLNVIVNLKKEGPCGNGCGQLITDTKSILSRLVHCSFYHVKRDANMVAHCMAKFVLSQLIDKVWVEEGLPFIIQHIVFAKQEENS
jgi:hypothetical protein